MTVVAGPIMKLDPLAGVHVTVGATPVVSVAVGSVQVTDVDVLRGSATRLSDIGHVFPTNTGRSLSRKNK